jgi:hypothetical protein
VCRERVNAVVGVIDLASVWNRTRDSAEVPRPSVFERLLRAAGLPVVEAAAYATLGALIVRRSGNVFGWISAGNASAAPSPSMIQPKTSTSSSAGHPSDPRAATPSSSTGTPGPRTCCACPTARRAPAGRCSWPAAGPSRHAAPRPATSARTRAGHASVKHTATATAAGDGLELHQLRHSAATHLGDQKVPLQLIMAKTRHKSPRTAMRCVKPGDAAVAEVTSLLGPPRRSH